MKKRTKHTPQAKARKDMQDVRFYLPEDIMARWEPDVYAADSDDEASINIYDVIGYDYFTGGGITDKLVNSVLRKNKGKAVTVNINSPGGDFFDGVAIYNLLKEHDGEVNVRIVGMAASAASVIAMAGDNIKIAESGFLMIHNAWGIVIGNKHEMEERADVLRGFDESMVGVYTKASNLDEDEIVEMMDKETWINGKDAVEMGFATQFLDSDELEVDEDEKAKYNSSLKEVDVILAKAGKSRSERRHLLKDLTSTPGAAVKDEVKPGADSQDWTDALASLKATLTS